MPRHDSRAVIALATSLALTGSAACGRSSVGSTSAPSGRTTAPQRSAGDPSGFVPSAPQSLASSLDAIQRQAAALPSTSADPAAKAAALGTDVESAFVFVRDQIRDEVYAGVLRGARGALLADAGNACDKSLLLASLLRARGFTVRFVRGHLAADRAGAIVDQMFASLPKPGRPVPPAPPQAGEPAARTLARTLVDDWTVESGEIQTVLRRDGVALGQNPPTPRSTLVGEAADHTWIEVQQNGGWTALDPSFRAAKMGEAFAPADSTVNDLPSALAHTITIRMVADERTGSTIASHDVLRYTDSAAALDGTLVVLTTPVTAAAAGWTAAPFIQVGDRLFTGLSFTGNGIVRTTIGRGMTNGLSAVTQAFGSGPPPPAATTGDLAAVWIVVDFHSPDGHIETVRRVILDRIGPAARLAHRESGETLRPIALMNGAPVALAGVYGCVFSTGSFPAGFAAAQLAPKMSQLRAAAPLAATIASGRELSTDERARAADELAPVLPAVLHAAVLAFYRASQASLELVRGAAPANVWFYEAAPRLAIASVELVPGTDSQSVRLQTSIDLRRNDMRAVSADANGSQVIWANALRGVLDGALEQTLFGDAAAPHPQLQRAGSTVAIFEKARTAHVRTLALRTPDALAPLNLPDTPRARMQAALDGGRTALVVPERTIPLGGEGRIGWWQIDLSTGETLGVLDSGLHQEFEEYEETTMVSRAWTGPVPKPTVWSIETTHGAIVATSEEAGLAAYGEELAKEVAYVLRFMK